MAATTRTSGCYYCRLAATVVDDPVLAGSSAPDMTAQAEKETIWRLEAMARLAAEMEVLCENKDFVL